MIILFRKLNREKKILNKMIEDNDMILSNDLILNQSRIVDKLIIDYKKRKKLTINLSVSFHFLGTRRLF